MEAAGVAESGGSGLAAAVTNQPVGSPAPLSVAPLSVTEAPARRQGGRRHGSRGSAGRANGSGSQSGGTTDPNSRSITITLPKNVADWYTEQAAQAPFRPSVQRYVAWQVEQWMTASQQQAVSQQKKQVANLDDYEPSPGVNDPR